MAESSIMKFFSTIFTNFKGRKIASKFFELKVQNPFEPDQYSQLGDLFFAINANDSLMMKISSWYGIEFPSECRNQLNPFEWFLTHKEPVVFIGADVPVIGMENIGLLNKKTNGFSFISEDAYKQMLELIGITEEELINVYRKAAENSVLRQLVEDGYSIETDNIAHGCVCVEKKFFTDHGLQYNDKDESKHPGFALLDISSVLSQKNSEISFKGEVGNKFLQLLSKESTNRLLEFAGFNISQTNFDASLAQQFIIEANMPDVAISAISGGVSDVGQTAISDAATNMIGVNTIRFAGAVTISLCKNYRRYANNELTLSQMVQNVGNDSVNTAGKMATGVAALYAVGLVGLNPTDAFAHSVDAFRDGFQVDDLGDYAELAIAIAAFAGVSMLIKKAWRAIAGDPLTYYNKLKEEKFQICYNISATIPEYDAIEDFCTSSQISFLRKFSHKLEKEMLKNRDILRQLRYYLVKRQNDTVLSSINSMSMTIDPIRQSYIRLGELVSIVSDANRLNADSLKNVYSGTPIKGMLKKALKNSHNSPEVLTKLAHSLFSSELGRLLPILKELWSYNPNCFNSSYALFDKQLLAFEECNAKLQAETLRLQENGNLPKPNQTDK